MIETASWPVTKDWSPAQDGMVRCADCKKLQPCSKNPEILRCQEAWKPACSPGKWRRCRAYQEKQGVHK